jgi:hypothetical protein
LKKLKKKCVKDSIDFELPDGMAKLIEEATLYHIKNNSHHPEYHTIQSENLLNKDDRDKPPKTIVDATKMPVLDIVEMVADWCAMSYELGGHPRGWARDNINVRWKFKQRQERLIYDLIDLIWY